MPGLFCTLWPTDCGAQRQETRLQERGRAAVECDERLREIEQSEADSGLAANLCLGYHAALQRQTARADACEERARGREAAPLSCEGGHGFPERDAAEHPQIRTVTVSGGSFRDDAQKRGSSTGRLQQERHAQSDEGWSEAVHQLTDEEWSEAVNQLAEDAAGVLGRQQHSYYTMTSPEFPSNQLQPSYWPLDQRLPSYVVPDQLHGLSELFESSDSDPGPDRSPDPDPELAGTGQEAHEEPREEPRVYKPTAHGYGMQLLHGSRKGGKGGKGGFQLGGDEGGDEGGDTARQFPEASAALEVHPAPKLSRQLPPSVAFSGCERVVAHTGLPVGHWPGGSGVCVE